MKTSPWTALAYMLDTPSLRPHYLCHPIISCDHPIKLTYRVKDSRVQFNSERCFSNYLLNVVRPLGVHHRDKRRDDEEKITHFTSAATFIPSSQNVNPRDKESKLWIQDPRIHMCKDISSPARFSNWYVQYVVDRGWGVVLIHRDAAEKFAVIRVIPQFFLG